MENGEIKNIEKICEMISHDDINIKFSGFTFSDMRKKDGLTNAVYDCFSSNLRVGKLCMGEGEQYHISFNPMSASMVGKGAQLYLNKDSIGEGIYNLINIKIVKALERDDKEFIKGITVDGNRYLPKNNDFYKNLVNENSMFNGYGEIPRKDIIDGTYKEKVSKTKEHEEYKTQRMIYVDKKEEELEDDYER